MNATQTDGTPCRPNAVVWIDERHAIVARCEADGQISTVEIRRIARAENRFVAQVVHEIAGRGRVMVIGTEPIRLALERRYVAVSHRPDLLVAPPLQAPDSVGQNARGLDQLAA